MGMSKIHAATNLPRLEGGLHTKFSRSSAEWLLLQGVVMSPTRMTTRSLLKELGYIAPRFSEALNEELVRELETLERELASELVMAPDARPSRDE